MSSLFEEPANRLEHWILWNTIWEHKAIFSPTHFKKHSAAEVYRYRITSVLEPEIWCPEFDKL